MKKLNVSFEGIKDTTGYLFSLAKALSAALRYGGYEEYAEDIIASSGFAFRMWAAPDLCPSATSIWEFKKQQQWIENGGLICDYVERLWGQDEIEEERRNKGIEIIKSSIDRGTAAVAWDISGCEWGLVTGYDDVSQTLYTLKINGTEAEVPYSMLGKLDMPILSVLTVTERKEKSADRIIADTKKLALSHLRGDEWCDNAQGLAAYDLLIEIVDGGITADKAWNLEYYLGTYSALRWYAWTFFDKYGEDESAMIYKSVYTHLKNSFDYVQKYGESIVFPEHRSELLKNLRAAKALEEKAALLFEK